jgi:hypothetical protein
LSFDEHILVFPGMATFWQLLLKIGLIIFQFYGHTYFHSIFIVMKPKDLIFNLLCVQGAGGYSHKNNSKFLSHLLKVPKAKLKVNKVLYNFMKA